MSVLVLGLDIASRTGWCRFDGESFETGVIDCTQAAVVVPQRAAAGPPRTRRSSRCLTARSDVPNRLNRPEAAYRRTCARQLYSAVTKYWPRIAAGLVERTRHRTGPHCMPASHTAA